MFLNTNFQRTFDLILRPEGFPIIAPWRTWSVCVNTWCPTCCSSEAPSLFCNLFVGVLFFYSGFRECIMNVFPPKNPFYLDTHSADSIPHSTFCSSCFCCCYIYSTTTLTRSSSPHRRSCKSCFAFKRQMQPLGRRGGWVEEKKE